VVDEGGDEAVHAPLIEHEPAQGEVRPVDEDGPVAIAEAQPVRTARGANAAEQGAEGAGPGRGADVDGAPVVGCATAGQAEEQRAGGEEGEEGTGGGAGLHFVVSVSGWFVIDITSPEYGQAPYKQRSAARSTPFSYSIRIHPS
jgi:hypothetical protein